MNICSSRNITATVVLRGLYLVYIFLTTFFVNVMNVIFQIQIASQASKVIAGIFGHPAVIAQFSHLPAIRLIYPFGVSQ